jgi:hypothetical protein
MIKLHLFIDQDDENIDSETRNQLVVAYDLTDPDLKHCPSSVELHTKIETWVEALREIIHALETLYGYEFKMEKFKK